MTNGRLQGPTRDFPAQIAEVIGEYHVVMNRGSRDGVKEGEEFVIYRTGKEVTDPETKESLGRLEITKGYAEAVHVQEKMTTLISSDTTTKQVQDIFSAIGSGRTKEVRKPFDDVERGDLVKPA